MEQDPVLVWVVGIATSLIAGALWAALAQVVARRAHGRGALAGFWYQVTFDPENEENAWSIEVVEVKHHGDRLTGTMWRVWPEAFLRRWSFDGRYNGLFIRSVYDRTRDDRVNIKPDSPRMTGSGSGLMKLYRDDNGCCRGRFFDDRIEGIGFGPQFVDFTARLEWVKFEGAKEDFVMQLLRSDEEDFSDAGLPGRIRRRLRRRLDSRAGRQVSELRGSRARMIRELAGQEPPDPDDAPRTKAS